MSSIDQLLKESGLKRRAEVAAGTGETRRIYLHAGQLYAADQATEIVTILGSCVSVCLFDTARHVGGLNHFLLPTDSLTVSPRHAKHAVDLLIRQLVALGASRSRLEAKIFGGASVLRAGAESGKELGARNVEAARAKLASERIPILGEDVGGLRGRKLVFFTADATALVRHI